MLNTKKITCLTKISVYLYANLKFMNWPVIIIIAVVLIALVIFLVRRNMKDEKEFETQLKNDYHKTKDEEGDTEIDEVMK